MIAPYQQDIHWANISYKKLIIIGKNLSFLQMARIYFIIIRIARLNNKIGSYNYSKDIFLLALITHNHGANCMNSVCKEIVQCWYKKINPLLCTSVNSIIILFYLFINIYIQKRKQTCIYKHI